MIKLGVTARDRITGFQGVVTGRCEYITGCSQLLLAPPVSETGEPRTAGWYDEQRCETVGGVAQVVLDNGQTPGCDLAAPVR